MRFESQSETAQETQFLPAVLHLLIVALLFATAFGIRVYHINEPPLDFHPTRQYRSAIIARGYYFETAKSIPEWRKQVASINKERQTILEPPIMELIASFAYRVVGGEDLRIPRLLSSLFWLIGGAFLYPLAKRLVSADAAVLSAAFYLFLPFGVSASRSFQPDPLMVMMLVCSVFTIFRYYDQPSTLAWAIAVALSALAMLVKPMCLFPIFGAFVSLTICRQGIRRAVVSPRVLLFMVLSLLPTILFYLYGIFIAGFFRGQAQGRFLPHLLLYPFFWKGWLKMTGSVVGHTALIGALLGVLMFREGLARALLIGLWIGYFVFGLVFTYHIHTHDYYQLQFIPIVALSLGPIAVLSTGIQSSQPDTHEIVLARLAILVLAVFFSIFQAQWRPVHQDFERQVRIAREIGEAVAHSTRTVFLTSDYGKPLQYYGELSGMNWPHSFDFRAYRLWGLPEVSAEERFNRLSSNISPEYFIVTDFWEFQAQKELRGFLAREFPIVVQNDDYLIFDLRKRASLDAQLEEQ